MAVIFVTEILHLAHKLHQAGERKLMRGRVYMFEGCREEGRDRMIQLKDRHRFKMVELITAYFKKGIPKVIPLND